MAPGYHGGGQDATTFQSFPLLFVSGAQWAQALVFQFLRPATCHHSEASGWPTCGIRWVRLGEVGLAWLCSFDEMSYGSGNFYIYIYLYHFYVCIYVCVCVCPVLFVQYLLLDKIKVLYTYIL